MLAKTYKIETERLIIRCYKPKDAILLKKAIDESLEHLLPWMPWAKYEPEAIESKIDRIRDFRGKFDLGHDYTFGIFNKDEKTLIGSTGLHKRLNDNAREIGYWLSSNYVKQGYAIEAVQSLIRVGFEIEKLDKIQIKCSHKNISSQSIPRKLGFVQEDNLDDDVMVWTLSKDNYSKKEDSEFYFKAFNIVDEELK